MRNVLHVMFKTQKAKFDFYGKEYSKMVDLLLIC